MGEQAEAFLADQADRQALEPAMAAVMEALGQGFARLMETPDAHRHVSGFLSGNVVFVVRRDGIEVARAEGTAA